MRKKRSFVALTTFLIALSLAMLCMPGCGGNQSKPSSKSSNYKQETFCDISFSVPKELTDDGMRTSDDVMYSLPETAKNPFATSLFISVFPFNGNTTQQWYEKETAEGESCELVSSNGIEMCWVPKDSHSDKSTIYSTLFFIHDEMTYMILLSYDANAKPNYKEFVENFYKSIAPADSDASGSSPSKSGSSSSKTKSDIPDNAIIWSDASKYMGKTISVYGPIVNTTQASSSTGAPTYLDMGAAYPDSSRVSVVIWDEDAHNFSQAPASMYKGKTICVTGELYEYSGACNIKVTSPSQIKIIN